MTFHEIAKIPVYLDELMDPHGQVYMAKTKDGSSAHSISRLNELEYDVETNTILANVIFQDIVIRIHPTTGWVSHIYDFSTLYPREQRTTNDDVFNGIAIVPHTEGKEWYVTGKYWSTLYHIRIHGE